MHQLQELLHERLLSGLNRKSLSKCSQWAEQYRVMGQPYPGKWTFRYHPWLREMHDSEYRRNVGQKAAQVGFTETMLNVSFFNIDIKGRDVLYVLPTKTPDATDFTASRFNPALELSSHLTKMFSDVQNIGHKRAGTRNLYIRGSRSRAGLKSVPVSIVILDEVDEMTQENIPLAFERTAGQRESQEWLLSTPTIEDHGINSYFKDSTQNNYFFRCPSCNHFIRLLFPRNIVITAEGLNDPRINDTHLICHKCKAILHHELKPDYLNSGKWVSKFKDRDVAGWQINQLYAPNVLPAKIARLYFKSFSSKADEQEFHNSNLGVTHAVEGARVSESDIKACISSYTSLERSTGTLNTIGIDQGPRWIHFEIASWTVNHNNFIDLSENSIPKVLKEGKVPNFEDLDELMMAFQIKFAIIDAQPERREATKFAHRFPGRVRLCYYVEGINGKQINISDTGGEPSISVDRTTWLDTSLGRFKNRRILLPLDVSFEYREHQQALTRVYDKDKWGNPIGRYVHDKPDHLAHARNYNEIALQMAASINRVTNVTNVL